MITEEPYVNVILIAHDDVDGGPKVEVKLQKIEARSISISSISYIF